MDDEPVVEFNRPQRNDEMRAFHAEMLRQERRHAAAVRRAARRRAKQEAEQRKTAKVGNISDYVVGPSSLMANGTNDLKSVWGLPFSTTLTSALPPNYFLDLGAIKFSNAGVVTGVISGYFENT